MSPKIERIFSSTKAALQSVEHHEHNLCFVLELTKDAKKRERNMQELIESFNAGIESLFIDFLVSI